MLCLQRVLRRSQVPASVKALVSVPASVWVLVLALELELVAGLALAQESAQAEVSVWVVLAVLGPDLTSDGQS